ncbi:MAG: RNA polymerase sigma factor [Kordiimonadaceae bacterium]|nr:RNA polymerase sigma factor [Kordiimonadaceae bacterium]
MVKKPHKGDQRYLKHSSELHNFLSKRLGNPATVDELIQDVFLKIFKNTKRHSVEKPRAYLFAVARNLLVDHFRHNIARQHNNMLEFDETIHTDTSFSEEKRLETREDLRSLAVAIRTLPPRTRKAFTLSRLYKYSYAEVGEMMGISPRTVEGHVAKGLATCTTYMLQVDTREKSHMTDNIVQFSKTVATK